MKTYRRSIRSCKGMLRIGCRVLRRVKGLIGLLLRFVFFSCSSSPQLLKWFRALQAMAFGSLMLEGYDVRISGQDVGRGTFSHRHAMLVNQKTEGVIVPLNDDEVLGAQGRLELANSSLSEMAVLGVRFFVFSAFVVGVSLTEVFGYLL